MEVTNGSTPATESTQSVSPETSAASTAPAQAASPEAASSAEGQTPAASGQAATPPAYTPNWKFKANQKEHEIPEFVRAAIKDADTEKKVKEIFEKAYGLEEVKPRYQQAQDRLKQFETQVMPEFKKLSNTVTEAMFYRDHGDYDSLFKLLRMDDQRIAQHLIRKVQLQQASPEQRAEYERARELTRRNWELEQQNRQLSSGAVDAREQHTRAELGQVLQRPEVSSIAAQFDAQHGAGKFVERVAREALLLEQLSGMSVSAEQAVSEVLKYLGPATQPSQAAASAASPGVMPTPAQNTPAGQEPAKPQTPPPVIPNVSGRGTSPTKKLARSVEDLRKMHAEMAAAKRASAH